MAVDSPPDTHGTQIESELNVEAGPNLNTNKEAIWLYAELFVGMC